jgi:hypothetical protein
VLEGVYEFLFRRPHNKGERRMPPIRPQGRPARLQERRCGGRQYAGNSDTGGLYERFFEVGNPVDGETGPLDFEDKSGMRRIVGVATEHGIEVPVSVAP